MRIFISALGCIGVTLGLFCFMATLITAGQPLSNKYAPESFIDFVRVKPQSQTETRDRKLPEKPKPPQQQPPKQVAAVAKAETNVQQNLSMDTPLMDVPLGLSGGPYLGSYAAGDNVQDGDVLPLVRIEPQYPRKAAMNGTEGFVVLEFDITETGSVANVSVLEAQPQRSFDAAARQALLKWKYKPKVVDGKPVLQVANRVRLDFKLQR